MRSRLKILFLLILGLWIRQTNSLLASPIYCGDVCSSSDCDQMCYLDQANFESDISQTCLDYGIYASCPTTNPPHEPGNGNPGTGKNSTCGNGVCDANETCGSCPADCFNDQTVCGTCGDGLCQTNEYGGFHVGSQTPQCGPTDVWCQYCPNDCGECDGQACFPDVCGGASQRYQCKPCDSDAECQAVDASSFCSYQEQQCIYFCSTDNDCDPSYTCQGGSCVPIH
jgi:hypothetical protein